MTNPTKAIPSGAKRDLLIINMAIGLITITLEKPEEVKNDKDLTQRTNKDHKLNKRIDRRLENLMKRLSETQMTVFTKYGRDGKLSKWVRSNLNSKFINIFNRLQSNTNLELLANQLLFECFMERDCPVIEEYKWLLDKKVYEVFDLLVETEAGKVTEETYEDARMIKRMIG